MIQSWDIGFTLSNFNTLKEFVKSFKRDDIHQFCILISDEHKCLIHNVSFLAHTKVKL